MQQETAAMVRAFMRWQNLDQKQLAVAAGVSQPTVSRCLGKPGRRAGRGRRRLFTYIQDQYLAESAKGGVDQVAGAFQRIWDGTPAHASAVAKIIDALDGLLPGKEPAA